MDIEVPFYLPPVPTPGYFHHSRRSPIILWHFVHLSGRAPRGGKGRHANAAQRLKPVSYRYFTEWCFVTKPLHLESFESRHSRLSLSRCGRVTHSQLRRNHVGDFVWQRRAPLGPHQRERATPAIAREETTRHNRHMQRNLQVTTALRLCARVERVASCCMLHWVIFYTRLPFFACPADTHYTCHGAIGVLIKLVTPVWYKPQEHFPANSADNYPAEPSDLM